MFRTSFFNLTFTAVVAFAAIFPFIQDKSAQSKKPAHSSQSKDNAPQTPKVVSKSTLPDFGSIKDVKTKKKTFFSYLKPIVEKNNQQILDDRNFIKSLDTWPTGQNKVRFDRIAKRYRIDEFEDFSQAKTELLTRVDVIPVSLVLMQAANESAWGTSRFAKQANNLFGQWCFKPGCGVVPEGRPEGQTYEVRKFDNAAQSVVSYFNNINASYAYVELRQLRQSFREMDEELDPFVIAEGLTPYSTRREAYVEEIQQMIRINQKYI